MGTALLFVPGGLLTFFHTGPFDWRGLLALWLPFAVFGAWIFVTSWVLDGAIKRDARELAAVGSGRVVGDAGDAVLAGSASGR